MSKNKRSFLDIINPLEKVVKEIEKVKMSKEQVKVENCNIKDSSKCKTCFLSTTCSKPQDKCGVVGIWAKNEKVANMAYFALYALQHRGQESAGIATIDGQKVSIHKKMGLVSQVFTQEDLKKLKGYIAVGHNRYSTTGSSSIENAQPILLQNDKNDALVLGHNGNLTNLNELLDLVKNKNALKDTSNDTAVLSQLLFESSQDINNSQGLKSSQNSQSNSQSSQSNLQSSKTNSFEKHITNILAKAKGAFSIVFSFNGKLYAARDPHGIRPLSLGRLDRGWVVASETAALDTIGARFTRDIDPGEIIHIDENGIKSMYIEKPNPTLCAFEYIYLARPDSQINGRLVHAARVEMGKQLAREHPVDADLVIPVPESGTPAAIGYSAESGIQFAQGLIKNGYVGRTFIQPSQSLRQLGIKLKLNPMREIVQGKKIVVVDDSIVRGNTQSAVVRLLRESGAVSVHVRISSPPIVSPCFYGVDFATVGELIAANASVDAIAKFINADSLGYISLDGMAQGTEQSKLCQACFTGKYPIEIDDKIKKLGKYHINASSTVLDNP